MTPEALCPPIERSTLQSLQVILVSMEIKATYLATLRKICMPNFDAFFREYSSHFQRLRVFFSKLTSRKVCFSDRECFFTFFLQISVVVIENSVFSIAFVAKVVFLITSDWIGFIQR